MTKLLVSEEVKEKFPDLRVLLILIKGVRVEKRADDLEEFKKKVIKKVKEKHTIDSLKDEPIIRTYRDFFWKIGIDPTKIRPASEALIRRVLQGKSLPQINTVVDAYNLASTSSGVPIAAFDYRSLEGNLLMRFARKDERFLGIGMKDPVILEGKEIVISDLKKLIAIYPYRDSDETKIKEDTKDVLVMVCGAPGVGDDVLETAGNAVKEYITRFCGGLVILQSPSYSDFNPTLV